MPLYYPLMTDLRGLRCLVVGGGRVAERRLAPLLPCGARVTVVAPEWTPAIEAWRISGDVQVIPRRYETGDLAGMTLVFAATDSPDVNRMVCGQAEAEGCWANNAAEPEEGRFVVPAFLRRGKLLLAVSTSGASPGLSRTIRDEWETAYGEEYEAALDFMETFRREVRVHIRDAQARKSWYGRLLAWKVVEAAGRPDEWEDFCREKYELLREDPDYEEEQRKT